jgi:anti-sigma-K factor RskA
MLDITPEVAELASRILASGIIPRKAATDAAHIARVGDIEVEVKPRGGSPNNARTGR